MSDELILEIIKNLNHKDFIPHRRKTLSDSREWKNYFYEPFFYKNKAYRLVWYLEDKRDYLLTINCFRRRKYEDLIKNHE